MSSAVSNALAYSASLTSVLRSARDRARGVFVSIGLRWRFAAKACIALGALALSACASLPAQIDRPFSASIPPSSSTTLGRIAQKSSPAPDLSGFRLMPLGSYSLDARVQLIRRAERSVDVQYYVIQNDYTGRLLLASLRDAAQRGVRVRLLVDDLHTADNEDLLRSLAAFNNVEVRLFNPFCCARGGLTMRFLASPLHISKLNRRMHNKLLIADGAIAIAGGRNVADEYFMRSMTENFVDMDALIVGAVVRELRSIFDDYWNSRQVYPVQEIVATTLDTAGLHQDFNEIVSAGEPIGELEVPPVDVLGYGPIREDLDTGQLGLIWSRATAFADPPTKVDSESDEHAIAASVTMNVLDLVNQATSEVVIASPYLIPGPKGIRAMKALADRGIKMTILTNSLAANDEPLVHTGYARYRIDMLKAGVDLYELSPVRTQRNKRIGLFGSSLGRLHAKMVTIDQRTVFIGSMNLDPRSASKNTELGVIVDSPDLAKEMMRVINISKLQTAYRLRLNKSGKGIEWLTSDDDVEMVLSSEPESSFFLRLQSILIAPFVPEQQL
jgi:cardiolipin synthase C